MYKLLFFIPFVFLTVFAFSQEETQNDSTKLKIGDGEVIFVGYNDKDSDSTKNSCKKSCESDWSGISFRIGANGYLSSSNSFTMEDGAENMQINYARSRVAELMFTHRPFNMFNDRLYASVGLGFMWNNYFFKNPIVIQSNDDATVFVTDTADMYDKYKLRVTYLQVPLVVGVRISKGDRPFDLQVGAVGGVKLGSVIKTKYEIDGEEFESKIDDDFNVNDFKLDATARLRFNDFGLFVNYSLISLFEDNTAPEVMPFSVGIVIGEF